MGHRRLWQTIHVMRTPKWAILRSSLAVSLSKPFGPFLGWSCIRVAHLSVLKKYFQLEGTIVELTATIERLKKESETLNDHARVKLRKNHRFVRSKNLSKLRVVTPPLKIQETIICCRINLFQLLNYHIFIVEINFLIFSPLGIRNSESRGISLYYWEGMTEIIKSPFANWRCLTIPKTNFQF